MLYYGLAGFFVAVAAAAAAVVFVVVATAVVVVVWDRKQNRRIERERLFVVLLLGDSFIAGGIKFILLAIWFCGNQSMAKGLSHLWIC